MRENFHSLQICRALAALMVVLFHLESINVKLSPGGLLPTKLDEFGFLGVDIFFVISGFIMSVVTSRPTETVGKFAWHRAARILPSYWLLTLVWALILALAAKAEISGGYLIQSLLVLPQQTLPILGPGWTLEHEGLFYAIVAIFLWFGKLSMLPIALAVLGCIGLLIHVVMPAMGYPNIWDAHLFSIYNFNFMAGVLLHRYWRKIPKTAAPYLALSGVLTLLIGGYLTNDAYDFEHVNTEPVGLPGLTRMVSGLLSAILLIAVALVVERDKQGLMDKPISRMLRQIGDSSYALYLIHFIAFSILGVVFDKTMPHNPVSAWLCAALSVFAVVMAAIAWCKVIEKPTTKWLQSASVRRQVA